MTPVRRATPRGVVGPVVACLLLVAGALPVGAQASPDLAPPPRTFDWVEDPPGAWPDPPPATAQSFVLVDADTGQVLAERAADEPRLVASTVKLLTVITALQELDPDDEVVVGPEADPGEGGAGASVDPGETWTVADLLDAILVRSGNDAARALAGAVTDGDLDAFTDRMEATAEELGLEDVVLTEPTGLDDANELSARALGTIARVALTDPRIVESASQDTVDLPDLPVLGNRNLLIGDYDGATGLKTGHTSAAGWCLVASAERDGAELVAVVLGAHEDGDRFSEAAALLDHGFEDLQATPQPALQSRTAGRWHTLIPDGRAWSPPGTRARTQLAGSADAFVVTTRTGGGLLGRRRVERPRGRGDGVGAVLADAMYRGMAAAHVVDAWPDGTTGATADTTGPSG